MFGQGKWIGVCAKGGMKRILIRRLVFPTVHRTCLKKNCGSCIHDYLYIIKRTHVNVCNVHNFYIFSYKASLHCLLSGVIKNGEPLRNPQVKTIPTCVRTSYLLSSRKRILGMWAILGNAKHGNIWQKRETYGKLRVVKALLRLLKFVGT